MTYAIIEFSNDRDPIGYFPYTPYETREDADLVFLGPLPANTTRELYIVACDRWSHITARIS